MRLNTLTINMLAQGESRVRGGTRALMQFVCHLTEKPALQPTGKLHLSAEPRSKTHGVIVSLCDSCGRPTVTPVT
jgi:hypothetical protein